MNFQMTSKARTEVISYTFRWNSRRNRPGNPLSEEEARARDAAGEEYTAVLPPRPGTNFPVLVTPVWKTGVVVVTFIDDFGRQYMEYTFQKRDGDRLFLTRVHLWTYPSDEPRLRLSDASAHEDIVYREDGYSQRVITNKVEGYKETVEYTDVPVDDNWEPMPVFGEYSAIGRFERGARPLDGNTQDSNNSD
jgi:hypothetical protein